ncbi:MAG: hypothetical protein RIR70_76 [Pseudomonadota bacterium]|jgi:hypothetical protein
MSNAASFEFRHLHRHLNPEERVPPLPSLLQQVELLAQDVRDARNHVPEWDDEDEEAHSAPSLEDDNTED